MCAVLNTTVIFLKDAETLFATTGTPTKMRDLASGKHDLTPESKLSAQREAKRLATRVQTGRYKYFRVFVFPFAPPRVFPRACHATAQAF